MEPIYDPEGEELKELVKRQGVQITEMQEILRSMRSAQRRHLMYRIGGWLLFTGTAAFVYYTYVWPHVQQILEIYGGVQGYQEQIADFFAGWRQPPQQ